MKTKILSVIAAVAIAMTSFVSLGVTANAADVSDLTVSNGVITGYTTSPLGELVIPSEINGQTITSIGDSAFEGCSGLTSVTIPESVTSISYAAFKKCSALTSVTIPNSVTSIGDSAFYYCSALTSVTIPNSVTSIGNKAFEGCSGLTSVTIPNSVTSIGQFAFSSCSKLTSVTIPESVTSISYAAFRYCSGLTSVTIPNSVTSIDGVAFGSCTKLPSVTIPNSVKSIGYLAFGSCTNLKSIYYNGTASKWESVAKDGTWKLNSNNAKIYVLGTEQVEVPKAYAISLLDVGATAFLATVPTSTWDKGDVIWAVTSGETTKKVDATYNATNGANGGTDLVFIVTDLIDESATATATYGIQSYVEYKG